MNFFERRFFLELQILRKWTRLGSYRRPNIRTRRCASACTKVHSHASVICQAFVAPKVGTPQFGPKGQLWLGIESSKKIDWLEPASSVINLKKNSKKNISKFIQKKCFKRLYNTLFLVLFHRSILLRCPFFTLAYPFSGKNLNLCYPVSGVRGSVFCTSLLPGSEVLLTTALTQGGLHIGLNLRLFLLDNLNYSDSKIIKCK